MKETVFLVHIKEKGYIKNITNEGEWIFTGNLKKSLKFRTLTGAYIRLVESKKIPDLFNLNGSIIIVEFYEDEFNVLSKLNYILSKETTFPAEENKTVTPHVTKEETSKLNEGVEEPKRGRGRPPKKKEETISDEPKRGRGRPPKEKVVLPEVDETKVKKLNEGVNEPKKRRGRPPKQNRIIEGYQATDELKDSNPPKKTANKVHTNHVIHDTTEEPLVKKKEKIVEETPETKIVESDLNVTIVKTSTEDSFWD